LINIYKRALDWKLHIATQFTSFFVRQLCSGSSPSAALTTRLCTQVTPAIIFAIVSCVRAADPNFETFDRWALVGMVVMGVLPTTVSR
jgi:solute carrier family 10 (sodium/bile acid cotransporter), member 7